MKLALVICMALVIIATSHADVGTEVSTIGQNVGRAFTTGSSPGVNQAITSAQRGVENMEYAGQEILDDMGAQLPGVLSQFSIDKTSLTSVASSFEKLKPSAQVDLIGELLAVPFDAFGTFFASSRKLLRSNH